MDIFDIIDDFAIEDDAEMYNYLNPPRKERILRNRFDHFTMWDDNEFWKRFRLKKNNVQLLLNLIINQIEHATERNQCVSPRHQLLLTLRFYATGSFYIAVGDFGGIHNSTVCKIIYRVTRAIVSLRRNFVHLPRNREEILAVQEQFFHIAQFPRVVAALDCTHIKIISPGGNNAETFRNRKGYFSLNVQAMCTADLKLRDVVARWQGSAHDSLIFANSAAKYQFDNGAFATGIVLADSGYFLNNYLLTPLRDPQTRTEQLYNESHIRTRNVIERCFGVWKRRFPVLSLGLRCKITLAQDIIIATAILHNLAIDRNEAEPPLDPAIEIPAEPVDPPLAAENYDILGNHTRDLILEYFSTLRN